MLILRRTFVAMTASAGMWLVAPARSFTQVVANPATPTTDPALQTGFSPVNGLQVSTPNGYCPVHATGVGCPP
jgi:hypothetical protein